MLRLNFGDHDYNIEQDEAIKYAEDEIESREHTLNNAKQLIEYAADLIAGVAYGSTESRPSNQAIIEYISEDWIFRSSAQIIEERYYNNEG